MTTVTFDEFLDAELPALTRYATVLTGNPHDAHDVVADALVRAHDRWDRIGTMSHPAAYVRRIVTSTFISDKRRWSTRHILPTRTGVLPDVSLPDPTAAYDDRQQLSALLATLPPRQRAVIVLHYYLGLDNATMADELGITTGAVRTAMSRGLSALRIAIDDETSSARHGHADTGESRRAAHPVTPIHPLSRDGS